LRLLLFNLAMDAEDPILGFSTFWIQALAEKVDWIDVITMRGGKIEVPGNVRVYSVGQEKGYNKLRRAVEFYRILGRLLASGEYHACFAHMMPLFAVMAAPLLGPSKIPIILWYAHKSVTPMLRLATLLVDRVVTASQESFRIPSSKVKIIGHGIDTQKFAPQENDNQSHQPFIILTLGRLSPIKRVELVIEGVALLQQTQPKLPVCLQIVGGPLVDKDKAYVAELKGLVERYRLENIVVFAGSKSPPEAVSFYKQASCFVNLSATGSLDKTVLEAMSCEVPVVTNPVFTEVLGEELAKTWVIEADASLLSHRLSILASMSSSEKERLGKQLRNIVMRDHSLDGLCKKLIDEFSSLSHKTKRTNHVN